ncbi:hypothetical protein [Streptomyces mirabilis]|uniref:hypothetical protein n=1 Tax=Streptomyces mirabilis TaxID=68239 RepID=UPI0033B5D336
MSTCPRVPVAFIGPRQAGLRRRSLRHNRWNRSLKLLASWAATLDQDGQPDTAAAGGEQRA